MPIESHSLANLTRRAALIGGALLLALVVAPNAFAVELLNFPPSDFDILSADTGQLIGHGHYTVKQTATTRILRGENRYLNGEYDTEEDQLEIVEGSALPQLVSFRHDFFNADGTPSLQSRLDMATGVGICGKEVAGKLELVSEHLKLPDDTYAGASVLLPIQQLMTDRDRTHTLKLHVYNCAPSPRLIAIDVKPELEPQTWVHYPGELEKIDIKANFGFWTLVIQPFIPKLGAWFDPSRDMLLVGAQLQRYYKGTKIILVRRREASIVSPLTTDKAPPVFIERPTKP